MPEITDVRVWPTKGDGNIKANADFLYDNEIRIKCSVRDGANGQFVGFPGSFGKKVDPKTNKKKWYSDVFFTNEEVKKDIETKVMAKYNEVTNGMNQGEAAGPTNQDPAAPF